MKTFQNADGSSGDTEIPALEGVTETPPPATNVTEFKRRVSDRVSSTVGNSSIPTGKVVDFRSSALDPNSLRVTYVAYNPGEEESRVNDIISDILSTATFNEEDAKKIIESKLHPIMHQAAREDAELGVFGQKSLDGSDSNGFGPMFRRGLKDRSADINLQLSDILSVLFGNEQLLLLSNYAEVLRSHGVTMQDRSGTSSLEDIKKSLNAIQLGKDRWKGSVQNGVMMAITNSEGKHVMQNMKIPEIYQKPVSMVLQAFFEEYVARVWEEDQKIRQKGREGGILKIA